MRRLRSRWAMITDEPTYAGGQLCRAGVTTKRCGIIRQRRRRRLRLLTSRRQLLVVTAAALCE